MLSQVTSIPSDLNSELSRLVSQMKESCGDNLVSLYLFGGIAKGEFDPHNSDINILIILKKSGIAELDKLSKAMEKQLYQIVLAPFIITEDELGNAVNLFPVKFLDITRNNLLLEGKDSLSGIKVQEELLKRNTRRELKNILFRLNHFYIYQKGTPELLGNKIKALFPSLLIHLNIMCYLKAGTLNKSKNEIIEQAGSLFGLDKERLTNFLAYKKGEKSIANQDIPAWYDQFMNCVRTVSSKADQL